MINVNMKSLLAKLNTFCTNTLHNAAGLTVSRTQYEVTVEHFLLKCLEDTGSDIPGVLRASGVDAGRLVAGLTDSLEDLKTGNSGKPTFSPLLVELFEDSWLVGSVDLGDSRIRSGAVLLAFLARPSFYGSGPYLDLLAPVNRESLLKDFWNLTKSSSEAKTASDAGGSPAGAPGVPGTPGSGEGSFIARFCQDFTAKAKSGGIDPVFGRDNEIRQIVDILARRRKNNPILVGDPGVGKTAVMEGLALRIAQGDVPESLQNVSLINLDMGLLEAGAGMKGEFENRLRGVINEVKSSEKPIIMFIDEAHTLVGAGGQAGGSDAANLLKPALARGELKTCAATTWSEYKKYFEKDPALARRFQMVKLDEPSVESTTLILRGLRDSYEKSHKVIIRDDAIKTCAEYSDRYIAARFLPDKAIDLLDTSCARVKVNLSAKPAPLEDAERGIQALEREKKAIERDKDNRIPIDEDRLKEVGKAIGELTKKAATLQAAWEKERQAADKVLAVREEIAQAADADKAKLTKDLDKADKALKELQGDSPMIQIEVNPDLVAQVVADWTGIPVGKVARDQAVTIANLEDRLKKRIKGQDMALEVVAQVIKAAKSGIKNPDQPMGVFLLVGPSGVGKTETGLTLADILFGDERNVASVNMSEFQEKHTVSRLIGSPPGYVGYGEGGMLTEAVRQHPYSVVLLDEVEKAHPDVLNLFYQVFDKGMLSDGEGKEINFKNTLVILTSNLATDVIQEMTKEGAEVPYDTLLAAVRPLLSQYFKPALLARMTVAPYEALSPDAMKNIVVLKLDKLAKMLLDNNKMKMTYTPKVVDAIASRCTEVETGARNIEYILNGNILPRMSQEILGHMTTGGLPGSVALDVAEDGSFKIDFA